MKKKKTNSNSNSNSNVLKLFVASALIVATVLIVNDQSRVHSCDKLGDDWSQVAGENGVPTFCYTNDWGLPTPIPVQLADSEKEGDLTYIAFSNDSNVVVSISTTDFKVLGESDLPAFDWSRFSLRPSADDLAAMFPGASNVKAEKVRAGAKYGLKVSADVTNPLSGNTVPTRLYLLQNVMVDGLERNITVTTNAAHEEDADAMVKSMRF